MHNVTICGSGIQGSMIAFRNAYEGKSVVLYDTSRDSLNTAMKKIDRWLEYYVSTGKTDRPGAEAAKARIRPMDGALEAALEHCELIIECVPEILSLKQEVWEQYDRLAPEKTCICTNSSSLKVSDIFVRVGRKEKTFAVNHDDPVKNSCVEMMWNHSTSEETKRLARQHWNELGYQPIITEKEIKGYSMNRTWRAVKKEILRLWAEGYTTPEEFDRGWKMEWGTKFGPFKYMDLIGLDTVYHIEMSYYEDSGDERDKPPARLKEMIDQGLLGMKSGRGFYDGYDPEVGNIEV